MINLETVEINKRVCKKCKLEKDRIHSGRYPNGKDVKYIGDGGLEWSGNTCPTCHKENVKEKLRTKRALKIVY